MRSFLDLLSLNATNGLTVWGSTASTQINDYVGVTYASAGDLNKDGIKDIIIGFPYANPSSRTYAGEVYVLYGSSSLSSLDLNNWNSTMGFRVFGAEAGDLAGYAVAAAGDVNKDGYDDIVLGAPGATRNSINSAGVGYVLFGSANIESDIDLANGLSAGQGFAVYGSGNVDTVADCVAGAGDVNNDGFDDIILGAPFATPLSYQEGYVVILYGGNTSSLTDIYLSSSNPALDASRGFKIVGYENAGNLGYAVNGAGDFNGDGCDDVVMGEPTYASNTGKVYVVYGCQNDTDGDLFLSSLTSSQGVDLFRTSYGNAGVAVSSAGDFNCDGKDDLLIGAYSSSEVYVVFGGSGNRGSINLQTLSTAEGIRLTGSGGDRLGWSVASLGDVNGDGCGDVLLGADNASPLSRSNAGEAWVVYGSAINASTTVPLSSMNITDGYPIYGALSGDRMGYTVASLGDVNGDGLPDMVLGSPFANARSGKGYIVFETAVTPSVAPTPVPTPAPTAAPSGLCYWSGEDSGCEGGLEEVVVENSQSSSGYVGSQYVTTTTTMKKTYKKRV